LKVLYSMNVPFMLSAFGTFSVFTILSLKKQITTQCLPPMTRLNTRHEFLSNVRNWNFIFKTNPVILSDLYCLKLGKSAHSKLNWLNLINTKNVLPQSYFKKSLWKYHEHYNRSYHIESYEIKGTSVNKIERYFRDLIIFESVV
jgi:hypothetical protein